jgi:hypothetical protein
VLTKQAPVPAALSVGVDGSRTESPARRRGLSRRGELVRRKRLISRTAPTLLRFPQERWRPLEVEEMGPC